MLVKKNIKEIRLGPSQREVEEFFNSIKESVTEYKWTEIDDPLAINLHENSKDFNECGSKIDSELLFQRIDKFGFDQDLARELMRILSSDELKARLSFENFRSIQAFEIIDAFIEHRRKKEIQNEIVKKELEIINLRSKLKYPKSIVDTEEDGPIDFRGF